MAYIGRGLDKISNIEKLDVITFDGSQSYTLQKNSTNFVPVSANNLIVSIDGVVQAGNFTVSGSTIDFGVAVASSSTCDFIMHFGTGVVTQPSDGSVTDAKLAASAINSQTAETTTASGDEFLMYDTSASALRKVTRDNLNAGGLVKISSQTITSAVGEVAFDNVMSSDFDMYKIVGYLETTHTALVTLRTRWGHGSTPTYLNTAGDYGYNYRWSATHSNDSDYSGSDGTGDSGSYIQIGRSDLRDAFAHFTITVANVNDANDGHHLIYWQYGHHDENENRIEGNNGQGFVDVDVALTSFKFFFSAGNINSGKVVLYGLKT